MDKLFCQPSTPPDAAPDAAPPADVAPPAAARCRSGGGGVSAAYFAGDAFQGPPHRRTETLLAFDSFAFLHDHVAAPSFTATFSGQLVPESTDFYGFRVVSDGGAVRLWIGGELAIDAWDRRCCREGLSAKVALQAGKRVDFLLELSTPNPGGRLFVYWRTSLMPGWTVIPPCALVAKEASPSACPTSPGDCAPPGSAACTADATNGVRGTYFPSDNLSGPGQTRTESFASSGWRPMDVPADAHSVRWETDLIPSTTEPYTLYLAAAGGTRVDLNGHTVVAINDNPSEEVESLPIELVAHERHHLLVVQPLRSEGFWLRLRWKSASVPRATIPKCRFFLPDTP